jgi:hypothetical protein
MTLQLRLSRFPGEAWVCGVHSSPHSRTEYRATPEFRRLSGQSGDKMPESFSITTQRTLRESFRPALVLPRTHSFSHECGHLPVGLASATAGAPKVFGSRLSSR